MKKIVCLVMLILPVLQGIGAQENIRDQIARIEVELNGTIKNMFLGEARKNEEAENNVRAELFKNITYGWYGSGFLYTHTSGETYFVTNKHVAEFSAEVSLVFENRNEKTMETKDVKLLYLDNELDLAVFELGETFTKEISRGFSLYTDDIEDGTEVWAAGYPDLAGKPAWQLSRGVVTNGWAEIEELVNPRISYLIQHSAPIDPGNSGGPLLISQGAGKGYLVAGVNTWGVSSRVRANTYFSLPASAVAAVVEKAEALKAGTEQHSLTEQLEQTGVFFVESLNSESYLSRNADYISQQLIEEKGFLFYQAKMKALVPSMRRSLEKTFFEGSNSAVLTMRDILYLQLYNNTQVIKKETESDWSIETAIVSEEAGGWKGVVTIVSGERKTDLEWVFENGNWKIGGMGEFDIPEVTAEEENVKKRVKRKTGESLKGYDPVGLRIAVETGSSIQNGKIAPFPNIDASLLWTRQFTGRFIFEHGFHLGFINLPDVKNGLLKSSEELFQGMNFSYGFKIGFVFPFTAGEKIQLVPGFFIGADVGGIFLTKYIESSTYGGIRSRYVFPVVPLKATLFMEFYRPEKSKYTWGVFLDTEMILTFEVDPCIKIGLGGMIRIKNDL